MKDLILIGAGVHCKSVIDSVDQMQYSIVGIIDDEKEGTLMGYPILPGNVLQHIGYSSAAFFVCIGDNKDRRRWFDTLTEHGAELINIIDPTAIIANMARMGVGNYVGKGAVIDSGAEIGDDCIINIGAIVTHDALIEDHVNISNNATVNGETVLGEGVYFGSAAVCLCDVHIGDWATVGAGAVVVKNVGANVTVVGCPAHELVKKH